MRGRAVDSKRVRRAFLCLVAVAAIGCAPDPDAGRTATSTSPVAVGPAADTNALAPSGPIEQGLVVSVTDGDTIRVSIDGEEFRVRYIGIDTPESVAPDTPVKPFALAASAANAALVANESVVLERDASNTDRFDRLLRYVWLPPQDRRNDDGSSAGWRLVNLELVRAGLAEAIDYPPDTKYSDLLHAAEDEARATGLAMWADG